MSSRDVPVAPAVSIHARSVGPIEAPVLMLLHGLGESGATWDQVLPDLLPRFRVVLLDLRGHGRSSWTAAYSFEAMRDDVIAVLVELDLGAVTLVGHSMGGVVAYLVAQTRHPAVRRLVVEDVAPPFAWERPVPARPDVELPFDWAVVPAIIGELDDPERRWWPGLASIDVPTLLVAGGDGSHIPQERLQEVAALVPDCSLVTIPVGHDVHESEPTHFAQALIGWLDSRSD